MAIQNQTLADLPAGTVVTFDRARARQTHTLSFTRVWYAEMWTTEGNHYVATVHSDAPPTLHTCIDHANADRDAWFLRRR